VFSALRSPAQGDELQLLSKLHKVRPPHLAAWCSVCTADAASRAALLKFGVFGTLGSADGLAKPAVAAALSEQQPT
jgi:hypothetical protein